MSNKMLRPDSGSRRRRIATGLAAAALLFVLAAAADADEKNDKPAAANASMREAIAEFDKIHAHCKRDADGNVVEVFMGGDVATNDLLVYLKAFPRLTTVQIRCARNVDDQGLPTLGELPGLKVLIFEYVPITDQGLKHLSKLSKLEELFLGPYKSKFGDDGLAYLIDLKSLRSLTFTGNAHVSPEGVKKLRAALPNCKIVRREEIKEDESEKPAK